MFRTNHLPDLVYVLRWWSMICPSSAEDSFESPVLSGNANEPVRPYVLHQTISLALGIREGDWKYLDHMGSGGSNYNRDGEWGLKQYALPEKAPNAPVINLKTDPGEENNLYFQNPERKKSTESKT